MTREEFRDHLAAQSGVTGNSETLDAEDAKFIGQVIDNCHEELEQMEVATWSVDDIPGFAVEGFVLYCKPSLQGFGGVVATDPQMKERGLRQLRYITADKRAGRGTADYF